MSNGNHFEMKLRWGPVIMSQIFQSERGGGALLDLLSVRNRQFLARKDIPSGIYPLCESGRVKLIPAIWTAVMI